MAIKTYKGKWAEEILANRKVPKGFPADLAKTARRKLVAVNNAVELKDLVTPPGNYLEELKGDRKGEHSIRINRQWRIVFRWTPTGPEDVGIEDYH